MPPCASTAGPIGPAPTATIADMATTSAHAASRVREIRKEVERTTESECHEAIRTHGGVAAQVPQHRDGTADGDDHPDRMHERPGQIDVVRRQ